MKQKDKTIDNVDIPKGYEICKKESTPDRIVLIKKEDKRQKLGKVSGYYVSVTSDVVKVLNLEEASLKNRNFFPTKELAEASLALSELLQYYYAEYKGYNPDFTNKTEKYVICVIKNVVSIQSTESKNSKFAFPSYDSAYEFYSNNKELLERAKPLL